MSSDLLSTKLTNASSVLSEKMLFNLIEVLRQQVSRRSTYYKRHLLKSPQEMKKVERRGIVIKFNAFNLTHRDDCAGSHVCFGENNGGSSVEVFL